MVAIVDYGVGNLFSLSSSLKYIGADCVITSDQETLEAAERIILPGVGAFEDAAAKLRRNGLDRLLIQLVERGKPLLGVCLGMQLLYQRSFEYGEHQGLGLLDGDICPITPELMGETLKVPHMGWNSLKIEKENCPIFKYISEGDFVYFVHSYFASVSGDTAASSTYGGLSVSAVAWRGNVYGTQFHPEKSGNVGLSILKAFVEMEVK